MAERIARTLPAALLVWLAVAAGLPAQSVEDGLERARREQGELVRLVEKCSAAFCGIGSGSGVCIRSDGLIVTNDHVAGGRDEWAVFFGDGRPPLRAKRLGADERGDVCLLKVIGDHQDLPFLPLADATKLKAGQRVMALGNPWLLSQDGRPTVTFGVISVLHYNQGAYSDAIVTDAAVNPGNSGGPLINMQGEVIGINGRIVTRFPFHRFNTGVAFAIPSNQISNFLRTLTGDEVTWHGALHDVSVYPSTDPRGVAVGRIYKSGPSFRAGLRYEDVITRVNGVAVTAEDQFDGLLATYPAGTRVTLSVVRDEKPLAIDVTLASVEPVVTGIYLGVESEQEPIDVTLVPRVHRVEPNSPAERAGFKVGDVLTHLDGRPIQTGEQFERWTRYHYPGKVLHIAIRRDDRSMILPLALSGKQQP